MSRVGKGVKGRKNRGSPRVKGHTEDQGDKGEDLALKKVAPG